MNHRVVGLVSLLAIAVLAGPAVARAEDALVAEVPFQFVVSGQSHDAGTYELRVAEDMESLELVPSKGPAGVVLIATRLDPPAEPGSEGRLVFDEVGGNYTLSEVWLPGQDGFLLHATQEEHTHRVTGLHRQAR